MFLILKYSGFGDYFCLLADLYYSVGKKTDYLI